MSDYEPRFDGRESRRMIDPYGFTGVLRLLFQGAVAAIALGWAVAKRWSEGRS